MFFCVCFNGATLNICFQFGSRASELNGRAVVSSTCNVIRACEPKGVVNGRISFVWCILNLNMISVYAFLFKMLKSQNVDCNIDTQYLQLSGLFLPGPFFITNVWQLMVSAWVAAIQALLSSEREVESAPKSGGGRRGRLNKVVLAYSGGLDTSVIVPWLR